MMKDFWKLYTKKCHSLKSAHTENYQSCYSLRYCPCGKGNIKEYIAVLTAGPRGYSSSIFFVTPTSTLSHPTQSAVSVGSVIDCALSLLLFYPLVDRNKACYLTKQINVRCKKVMMWRWTLTPKATAY